MRITRKQVVTAWMNRGLDDFVIQFVPLKQWVKHQPFYLEQGLEKICKAFLIGKDARKYRRLSFMKARAVTAKLAKSYAHHKLSELVLRVSRDVPKVSQVVSQFYGDYNGQKILEILEKGYIESRYPPSEPVYRDRENRFIVKRKHYFVDPTCSDALQKFTFAISRVILHEIEEKFHAKVQNQYSDLISDNDWKRFLNLLQNNN